MKNSVKIPVTALLLIALFWVSPAYSGTAEVKDGDVYYTAIAAEVNTLEASSANGEVLLTDSTAPVTAGDGCTLLHQHAASCATFGLLVVDAGDLNDRVTILSPNAGGPIVYGKAGADVLEVCSTCNSGKLYGNGGGDTLTCGSRCDLRGGVGNDFLTGGPRGDILADGSGDDFVSGGGGSDLLVAGTGRDSFDGGAGKDWIDFSRTSVGISVDLRFGVAASETRDDTLVRISNVFGTRFDDHLVGDGERNDLVGMAGKDTCFGAGGNDVLEGWTGDDHFAGGTGDDLIFGQAGNDVLIGGAGQDRLRGAKGQDRFYAEDGEADTVIGGADQDRAWIDSHLDLTKKIESFF